MRLAAPRPAADAAGGPGPSSSVADVGNGDMELEAPPRMRHMETAEEVAERKARKLREQKKAEAMRAVGSVARQRLSERSGPQRSTLFDANNWKEQTEAKSKAMEHTYSRLYKPSAGGYWTAQRNGTQPPVRPVHSRPVDRVPTYAGALPTALSLAQPAFRAMGELHGEDPAEPAPHEPGAAEAAEPFDPMAEPTKFFQDFKERVGHLRDASSSARPAELEPARPAATSASLPPLRTQAPGAEAAKKKAPLPPEPEQDFTVDALPDTAIYLTSLGGETTELLPTWEAPDAPWGSAWDEPLTLA